MTKDNEAIRENIPVVLATKEKVVKKCSCSESTGRDIKCVDHGDRDKIGC
jgi:hypothetical protein